MSDLSLAKEELLKRLKKEQSRRASKNSLEHFTLYTYDGYMMGWFHRKVSQVLDKFLEDVANKKSPRLVITAPPRSGKSELVSRRFPAYAFGKYPDLQIIATSYSAELTMQLNQDVQRIIDNESYNDIFPNTTLQGSIFTDASKSAFNYARKVDLFQIVGHKGQYRSTGVGGSITGMGADILIIDDPVKDRESARSSAIRNKTWDWYTSTAYTRLSPGGGVIIMATRWHPIKDTEMVLTLDGFKMHGDLEIGDYVYGLDFIPIRVVHIGDPVWCDYEITAKYNGKVIDTIICGAHHLWPVRINRRCVNLEAKDFQPKVEYQSYGSAYRLTCKKVHKDKAGYGRCITTASRNGIYRIGIGLVPTHNCDDLIGRILARMQAKEGEAFEIINFPAIAEHEEEFRKKGDPLHPERFPLEALQRIRDNIGESDFAALYQQRPVPEGGAMFKQEWIQYYTEETKPKSFDSYVMSWDMSFKGTNNSDYVVGQVWGRKGANFYLLDQVRGQYDFVQTVEKFVMMSKKWQQVSRKLVEDKANGPAIISALRNKVSGIIPINPKESKEARASSVTTFWEAHNVYLPNPSLHQWVAREFLPELLSFPSVAHDDQVDAMTQALNDMKGRSLSIHSSNLQYLGF